MILTNRALKGLAPVTCCPPIVRMILSTVNVVRCAVPKTAAVLNSSFYMYLVKVSVMMHQLFCPNICTIGKILPTSTQKPKVTNSDRASRFVMTAGQVSMCLTHNDVLCSFSFVIQLHVTVGNLAQTSTTWTLLLLLPPT